MTGHGTDEETADGGPVELFIEDIADEL